MFVFRNRTIKNNVLQTCYLQNLSDLKLSQYFLRFSQKDITKIQVDSKNASCIMNWTLIDLESTFTCCQINETCLFISIDIFYYDPQVRTQILHVLLSYNRLYVLPFIMLLYTEHVLNSVAFKKGKLLFLWIPIKYTFIFFCCC